MPDSALPDSALSGGDVVIAAIALAVFAVIVFLLLLALPVTEGGWGTRIGRAGFFLLGAFFSALVGFIGMTLATRGNVRVAAAARGGGYPPSFGIAYRTGGVFGVITLGPGPPRG